jgi:hypothetical protein
MGVRREQQARVLQTVFNRAGEAVDARRFAFRRQYLPGRVPEAYGGMARHSHMTIHEGDIVSPISNSELQTWMDCHRRWFFSFYREMGVKRSDEAVTGALAFGTRIHICLERMYANGENPLEVYEELQSKIVFDILVHEQKTGYVDKILRRKAQSEREMAHAMLEGFIAWASENGIDEGLEVAGAEIVVEVASGIEGVRLRGKLDQRVWRKIDGARLYRDFKTAANLEDGPAMLPLDEQMLFYMMLERLDALTKLGEEASEPTIGGLYLMLKKNKHTAAAKPPFYAQVEVHHNARELESMRLRTHKRIKEILEARRELDTGGDIRYWAYPRPTRDCKWKCVFLPICPMVDDSTEETWGAMLMNLYEPRDPYERYQEEEAKA